MLQQQDVRTEIERILSERADDWERLRPFALKCPECSAPVESGKTECKYCKVPLVWEPKESLSRDDHWMRIASARASQPPPSSSTNGWLSFGPTTILAMSKKTFKWRPQVPLRPYRLVLIGDLDRFHVTSIRKGPTEILAMGYAPARAFGPTEVSPAVFQDYTIYVAETFAITIENVTPANQNISGYVETRSLGDPPPRQAAVEEEDSP
jgi:hypothetical protein